MQDIQDILDRPPTDLRPPARRLPMDRSYGGSCRCACHTEEAQMVISAGLMVFGLISFFLGFSARSRQLL